MYNGGIFAVRDLQGKMSAKCEVRNAKLIAFINPFRIPHSAFCILHSAFLYLPHTSAGTVRVGNRVMSNAKRAAHRMPCSSLAAK